MKTLLLPILTGIICGLGIFAGTGYLLLMYGGDNTLHHF